MTDDHFKMTKHWLDFERLRRKNHPPKELDVRFDFSGDIPLVCYQTDQAEEISKTFVIHYVQKFL